MIMNDAHNVQDLLIRGYEILKGSGIDTYMIDCQLLLGKVLNMDRMGIMTNRHLGVEYEKVNEYFDLVELRRNKMPVKYILKECEFMGLNFHVEEGVLIPRPDTEILVEMVIEQIRDKGYKTVCDVCCGSGAIGLSIASIINDASVELCDLSNKAVEITNINIEKFQLKGKAKCFESNLLDYALKLKKRFQVVVSNPPYIREEVIPTLMEDVRKYEPYIALSGGEDGLEFYRKITQQSTEILECDGLLAFEIGHDQAVEVKKILAQNNFHGISCIKDLAGNDRVVLGILG